MFWWFLSDLYLVRTIFYYENIIFDLIIFIGHSLSMFQFLASQNHEFKQI